MDNSEIKINIKKIINDPYSADELTQNELENIIKYAADKFFNTKTPVLEDNIYDILIDFLKSKYPKSKVLKLIGAKIKSKNKVKLDYWLGSMNKIKYNSNELNKWLKTYRGNYILSDKLDGISALLIYRINDINKKTPSGTINMYTRGTASEGLDITPLIKYINVPTFNDIYLKIINKANKKDILIALRGELIIQKNTFEVKWSKIMKNTRNTVSGLVNSKNINPQLAYDTDFVVYEIIDPIMLPDEQLNFAKILGFKTVKYKIFESINFELLSEYFKKRRIDSLYNIDGIIVTNNILYERNLTSNPEYSFAFKDILEEQMAETTILDIEWNVSKDGLIKPILILNPINIGGVTISRVTGNNAKNIIDNKLGKNAIVKIIRSGDVIPKIEEVIKPSNEIKMPEIEWSWNKTNVDIISNELNSNEILIKNIYYFFSTLNTKGIGIKIIEKLVNANLNSVKKILIATPNDFLNIEGIKEKSANNLFDSIKNAISNVSLSKFMAASNKLGAGIGEERIKLILDNYPNLMTDYKNWSNEEFIDNLKKINGFEKQISSLFVFNFNGFIKFYDDIKKFVNIILPTVNKSLIKNKYSNLNIVISGFRDAVLQKFLEDSGAKLENNITKNTDLLIVKDEETIGKKTEKVKKALNLGINIIIKNQINKKI